MLFAIIFGFILIACYYYAGVYAAPLAMGFVFGWSANALGGHPMTVAIAAFLGAMFLYFILGALRQAGESWPFAHTLEMLILFVPSFLAAAGFFYLLMRDEWERGFLESGLVAAIVGTLFGLIAYGTYLNKHGTNTGPNGGGDPK